MVAGNLVKLVKVGNGCRRVGQVVLRAGHTIWALVRWASGTACGQVYTVWAFADQKKVEPVKTFKKANEGLESRSVTAWRCRRAGKPSLPKLEIWLSIDLGFPKDFACTL